MAEATFSLDLHVLGPPLTFALSQDQTLRRKFEIPLYVAPGVGASGGRPPRATWNGFCSVRTRNPRSSKRLAIQFSETDRRLGAFSSSVPTVSAVEGCCLYGMTFRSSTVIEKIFHRPVTRRQPFVLPEDFRAKNSTLDPPSGPTTPPSR